MPDPIPNPPPIVLRDGTVASPSPEPGQPAPQRRAADQPGAFKVQWTALISALLVWAVTFLNEIASTSWEVIRSKAFIANHAAQIIGVILAVVFAKQIKS